MLMLISGRSLLDGHVWSPFGRSTIAYRTWIDDRVGAINNIHWWMARPRISGQLLLTQATEATSKTKCPKKPLSPQTISPPKVEKPTYRPPIYTGPSYRPTANPPCKFSRRSARDICPRAKIHIFPYKGLPWGLPKVYCTDVLIFVTGAL